MNLDEIDRILSSEENIVPSSGFTESVLRAAQERAAAPQPIPFPWKRALAGIAAWVTILCTFLAQLARPAAQAPSAWVNNAIVWPLLASLVSLAGLLWTKRLMSR
ncbi:MAG: hypothetical protein JO061_12965 [Acidobacteriaceae bacterium]|nr:hypothetical protein [Acidobacteriaceae bacterium]